MFFCELILLVFLILSKSNIQPVSFEHQYNLWFYVPQYFLMLFLYSLAIIHFGPKEYNDTQTLILESILMGLQILSFLMSTLVIYEIDLWLVLLYEVLFLMTVAYLLKKLIQIQKRKKEELSIHFLQEQLDQKIRQYIHLKEMDSFRKLRHDYINFLEQHKKSI